MKIPLEVCIFEELPTGDLIERARRSGSIELSRLKRYLTRPAAVDILNGFVREVWAPSMTPEEVRFYPGNFVAGATFPGIGRIFIDGNGIEKVIAMPGE